MDRKIFVISLLIGLALLVSACQPDEVTPTPAAPGETPEDPAIPETGDEWINQGESIYAAQCATCHGVDGEGMEPQFPPLDGNPVVLSADPDPGIEVVLHGRGAMPAFSAQLTNEEVAQVVSYIRNAWTNDASTVTEGQVEAIQ
jgi:mono/diheme cytochrome c family protein